MNYYLTLEDNFKIDLSKLNLDKKELLSLKYIDNMTMQTNNEMELKEYLKSKGLISDNDINKSVCISYGDKDKRFIPVLYARDKVTIDNLKKLSDDIKKYFEYRKQNCHSNFSYESIIGNYNDITSFFSGFEVLAGNHKFLIELQRYISGNPKQNVNANDIAIYINQFSDDKKSKYIYIALFEIFINLFYKFDKETKELKFSYKGFRDFCVFYCNYKRKINNKKTEDLNEEIEEEYEEPVFPPNSEEEARYFEYLERLNEIASNRPIEDHPRYGR